MAPGVAFEGDNSKADPPDTSDVPEAPPPPPSVNNGLPTWRERQQSIQEQYPPTTPPVDQFTNLPAALLSNLKREKKPFTYTPGGINLSEIKSPRMQKRLEANRKLQGVSPLAKPPEASGGGETKTELVVLPVYNSPLNHYSNRNAKEELQKRASMLTKELESLALASNGEGNRYSTWSSSKGSDPECSSKASQSRSFRMLQLMTDTSDESQDTSYEPARKHEDDEMRFTGITREPIPSRFFHTLQRITGTDLPSPEPPQAIQYDDATCPLQDAAYGKDFIPPPKSSQPFDPVNNIPAEWRTVPSRKDASQRNSYPQVRSNEEPPPLTKAEIPAPQFHPIGHAKSFSDVHQRKPAQPFIRPNFQAVKPGATSVWQPSANPYAYCTIPRGYRGIPGLEGTDL